MKIPAEGAWSFETAEIAEAFDDHVREQLPWYDLVTGVVAHLVRHYLPVNGILYDIGASTGNISTAIRGTLEQRRVKVIPLEPSKEMASIYSGLGDVVIQKAEDHSFEPFDVAVAFLTMMFIPVDKRAKVIDKLVRSCKGGGCIIIFDKTAVFDGYLSTVMNRLTLAGKVSNNTPPDEIIKKELSLSGCQRPFNLPDYHDAKEVFRFGDFAGWIIEV